jgi:hypothetical protein
MFYGVLPKKYHFSHRFAFELHDAIAGLLEAADEAELFLVRFDVTDESLGRELQRLQQGEMLDWMLANGFRPEAQEVIYRAVIRALLADFCHFVFECLQCSAKGKLTVSHALMRKPFKETLFILEWMLVDKQEFLRRFEAGPECVDMYKLGSSARKGIVMRAVAATTDDDFLDGEFIYEMRFAKDLHYSFERLWNQSVHLVTTDRNYRTETQNINFVFSGEEEVDAQWHGIYSKLPYLMVHAVRVVEQLIREIDAGFLSEEPVEVLIRSAAILLWSGRLGYGGHEAIGDLFRNIFGQDAFACEQCRETVPFDYRQAIWLYRRRVFRCHRCGNRHPFPEGQQGEGFGEDVAVPERVSSPPEHEVPGTESPRT